MIEQKFGGICPPEKLSTKLLYTPSDDQFKEAIQTSNFFFFFDKSGYIYLPISFQETTIVLQVKGFKTSNLRKLFLQAGYMQFWCGICPQDHKLLCKF